MEALINACIHGNSKDRDIMHKGIYRTLKMYRVPKWPLSQCYVKPAGNDLIDIIPRQRVSDRETCPDCGTGLGDIGDVVLLRIHPGFSHEEFVYGCRCGKIFGVFHRKEDEGETGSGN